jgi:pyrroline-5-carboxylate reductase
MSPLGRSASTGSQPRYEYGILGVGEIGEAIVTGLCARADSTPSILLSPRNRERATALASRYPSVAVAADNQVLVDQSATLVVSLRPADRAVLAELRFRDQAIVSVMAGVSLHELRPLLAPAREIARAIPLPALARRPSVTPIQPATEAARALFDQLGGSAAVDDVGAFEAMSAATATIAAQLRYLATISRWLSEQGVAAELASRYVSSIFAGVAEGLGPADDLDALARIHASVGGINERFDALLREAGVFDVVENSLTAVYELLRAPATPLP